LSKNGKTLDKVGFEQNGVKHSVLYL
jgi:hypothetical protein